jgi:hypothetical protein
MDLDMSLDEKFRLWIIISELDYYLSIIKLMER